MSITIDALAPIVGLHARLPGKDRAEGTLIFRAGGAWMIEAKGIPNRFARVPLVVSGVVLGRRRRSCHRCDNQTRAKQAKKLEVCHAFFPFLQKPTTLSLPRPTWSWQAAFERNISSHSFTDAR
jgi:hypothetical protein